MGAQLSLLAQTAPSIAIFSYIDVLDEVHYVSQLNSSRFLKTCKALDPNGEIIIKVFIKPKEDYNLKPILSRIETESQLLSPLPNVLNYSKIIESNRAAYMIRQHLKFNLYDRLSSRPYLQSLELKFIAFQLLQTINEIHNLGICHGDIKTENILVLSWNWILLTDFAAHLKPIYLPEDNPGEFSFYFDTSKRRSCYLAPERFDNSKLFNDTTNEDTSSDHKLTMEMDIFSTGCCIAELFTEGRPIFNLSQLFKYKANEFNVENYLKEQLPNDEPLRSLILDMIKLNPSKRLSCHEILQKYRKIVFPDYFYTFTYDYIRSLAILGTNIPSMGNICTHTCLNDELEVLDQSIEKIYNDFTKISYSLNYPLYQDISSASIHALENNNNKFFSPYLKLDEKTIVKIQPFDSLIHIEAIKEESALLFISFISHSLRNIVSISTKQKCLQLLTTFAQFVSDENKIDRIVPYIVSCFQNDMANPDIQILTIQNLIQVLYPVERLNQLNENVFVDYLLPRLKNLLSKCKDNSYVKMVFANCFGDLVSIANKFQDITFLNHNINAQQQQQQRDNAKTSNSKDGITMVGPLHSITEEFEDIESSNNYRYKLINYIEDMTITLLTDSDTIVKMALLNNILPLCRFFGRERTNDIILSHLITYLNDKNSALRLTLIENLPGMIILLGPLTFESFILPLLIQTLIDSEELIVVSVLHTLKNLLQLGFINKKFFYDTTLNVSPLLLHPNHWIREFTLGIISEICANLSNAEIYCLIYPTIGPFFEFDLEFTFELMVGSCKQPITRTMYNLLYSWSLRASKSLFWNQIPSTQVDSFGNKKFKFITRDFTSKNYGFNNINKRKLKISNSKIKLFDNNEIPLTTEDKNWIDKFKTIGLKEDELWKLAILRPYVIKISKSISTAIPDCSFNKTDEPNINLQINSLPTTVMPRNVFFDIEFTGEREELQLSSGDSITNMTTTTNTTTNTPNSSAPSTAGANATTNGGVRNPLILDRATSSAGSKNSIPTIINNHGSLILKTRSVATTTIQNLKNIYVQLEPNSTHMEANTSHHVDSNKPKFLIKNSYEGDIATINAYLENFKILPSLRKYKEFGPTNEFSATTSPINGKLVTNLMENEPNSITGLVTVNINSRPYLISSSTQGLLKLWNIQSIASGEMYSSCLTHDCESMITDMVKIKGYETIAVSTRDGQVILLRAIYQQQGQMRRFTRFHSLRKISILEQREESRNSEFVLKIRTVNTDDVSYIFMLTNLSNILIYDIRTMELTNTLKNPVEHGAVLSFTVNEDATSLICGTSKGILDIWDLRFSVLLKSWTFGNNTPITHIELCPDPHTNTVIVVGGTSESMFTIWDYSTIHCVKAFLNSDTQPSLEHFQATEKYLEDITFKPNASISQVTALCVNEQQVILVTTVPNEVFIFDLAAPMNSEVLSSMTNSMKDNNHYFTTIKATTTLELVLRKKRNVNEMNLKTHAKLNFLQQDSIIKIACTNSNGKSLLLLGNNSGIIIILR
ncbi:ubiquitin-binding serine/threonine protein kinase VPS15 NDAI_0A07790 [Naumovozyma dairenensis CBS 421]|uniref:non-specific serine/threonine protein kinase n=1 Tax=Naumovozyma dairenensis (strain ATCC 10597 / BCRC 20456 / CBS 421 / NBRC 0211 / NRRL Y-12639) TaxID=1071378 RepID=G0W545_NAUDC|nr:hypothetical protein NDAI_0A07790 [Naumovozyma dairenensis CBS 421]CCD22933.1 hypothetical protein NDAI_0A07790 [Naumovozyma dairenensis CBS 421]